ATGWPIRAASAATARIERGLAFPVKRPSRAAFSFSVRRRRLPREDALGGWRLVVAPARVGLRGARLQRAREIGQHALRAGAPARAGRRQIALGIFRMAGRHAGPTSAPPGVG